MTKKLVTYVESKRKAWQHWPWADWIFIETLAKELDIPQHEVIFSLARFVRQDKEHELEFRRYLKELHPGKVVQKGTSFSTSDRALGIIRCPKCGLKGTKSGLAHHLSECEGRLQPLQQLAQVET